MTAPIECIPGNVRAESPREVLSVDGVYRTLRESPPQVYDMEPVGGLRDTCSRSGLSNMGLRSRAVLASERR